MKKSLRLSGIAVVFGALVALASSTLAGPPLCPDIYAPVLCSNGVVYPNLCYATKAKAKNCVPYGDPI